MENREENLSGQSALAKIREIVDEAKTCLFCTDIRTGVPLSVRPMRVLQVDDEGYLWFISTQQSRKEEEVEHNPFVHLMMQTGQEAGFLNLYGIAEEQDNQTKIDELWNPDLDIWFDGPQDASVSLIRVEVLEGHYWDSKHNAPIAAFKGLKALVTGKSEPEEVIHGNISI